MILITSGCSFSECINHRGTWPAHLQDALECEANNMGMGSAGNGLISRRLIYAVTEALKTNKPEDLLVGVMWSGPQRHDFYLGEDPKFNGNIDGWLENPTTVVPNSPKSWVILNHGWKNEYAKEYYGMFHHLHGGYIQTYEHILRVQWFLKLHNIKYFMSTYTGEVLVPESLIDTDHLREQVDFEQFLPVTGEAEWCRDYSGLEFPLKGDNHPSPEQHKMFTHKVILPFLKDKGYI